MRWKFIWWLHHIQLDHALDVSDRHLIWMMLSNEQWLQECQSVLSWNELQFGILFAQETLLVIKTVVINDCSFDHPSWVLNDPIWKISITISRQKRRNRLMIFCSKIDQLVNILINQTIHILLTWWMVHSLPVLNILCNCFFKFCHQIIFQIVEHFTLIWIILIKTGRRNLLLLNYVFIFHFI